MWDILSAYRFAFLFISFLFTFSHMHIREQHMHIVHLCLSLLFSFLASFLYLFSFPRYFALLLFFPLPYFFFPLFIHITNLFFLISFLLLFLLPLLFIFIHSLFHFLFLIYIFLWKPIHLLAINHWYHAIIQTLFYIYLRFHIITDYSNLFTYILQSLNPIVFITLALLLKQFEQIRSMPLGIITRAFFIWYASSRHICWENYLYTRTHMHTRKIFVIIN